MSTFTTETTLSFSELSYDLEAGGLTGTIPDGFELVSDPVILDILGGNSFIFDEDTSGLMKTGSGLDS